RAVQDGTPAVGIFPVALTDRVWMLEKRNRRLRNLGIGLALFVIASLAIAQQRQGPTPQPRIPDVIEAKKFVLKDEYGVIRAVLETTGAGGSQMVLFDRKGKARLDLGSFWTDEGFVEITGPREKVLLQSTKILFTQFPYEPIKRSVLELSSGEPD